MFALYDNQCVLTDRCIIVKKDQSALLLFEYSFFYCKSFICYRLGSFRCSRRKQFKNYLNHLA